VSLFDLVCLYVNVSFYTIQFEFDCKGINCNKILKLDTTLCMFFHKLYLIFLKKVSGFCSLKKNVLLFLLVKPIQLFLRIIALRDGV